MYSIPIKSLNLEKHKHKKYFSLQAKTRHGAHEKKALSIKIMPKAPIPLYIVASTVLLGTFYMQSEWI